MLDVRAEFIHGTDSKWLFNALGKFCAKIIIDGLVTGLQYNSLLLHWLTGKSPMLEYLKELDVVMYNSLQWILENDISHCDLTFSASYVLFDINHIYDLIENGRNVNVINENKRLYVDCMITWLIRGRYEPACTHFLQAFHSLIPVKYLQHFSVQEIQLLIGGNKEVNVGDIKSTAFYGNGYTQHSEEILWFWKLLSEMNLVMLTQLLLFITGSTCISPLYNNLNPPLTITKIDIGIAIASCDRSVETLPLPLPVAHTCFNQLMLPNYSSYEVMKEKLYYAIEHGNGVGFHIS